MSEAQFKDIVNFNKDELLRIFVSEKHLGAGIFFYGSLMNHSCICNTSKFGIGDFIIFYAIRDIEPGHEITTSYISITDYKPRQEKLLENWEFECRCPLCIVDKSRSTKDFIKEYEEYFNEFNEKYPLPILYKCPLVEFNKGEVKACLVMPYTDPDNNYDFASIHTNPPGKSTNIPAIIEVNYGKGKVIWSLNPIEADPRFNFKDVFMNIVGGYIKPLFTIKASKYVEAILFEDKDDYYLNLFDLNLKDRKEKKEIKWKNSK